jgi:hypothetical protein
MKERGWSISNAFMLYLVGGSKMSRGMLGCKRITVGSKYLSCQSVYNFSEQGVYGRAKMRTVSIPPALRQVSLQLADNQ